jgi:hypothetical protein
MELLVFRERIRTLRDELVAAVRTIVPEGLSDLPQPFTQRWQNHGGACWRAKVLLEIGRQGGFKNIRSELRS